MHRKFSILAILAILAPAMLAVVLPLSAATRNPGGADGAPAASLAIKPTIKQAALGNDPDADAKASDPLQDAVASVVVVALTEQFDGKAIAVNIDDYNVQVSGARERMVSGTGTVTIGSAATGDRISFNYRTLYDTVSANAAYPAIAINSVGGGTERPVPNDASLIGQLDERVSSALSSELGGKPVWLQLDSIETFESGERYVRINAQGIADFGIDGSTPASIEALFDRRADAWLRVNYQFGTASAAGNPSSPGR